MTYTEYNTPANQRLPDPRESRPRDPLPAFTAQQLAYAERILATYVTKLQAAS